MPDVHMGRSAVVGFTMTANNYIAPAVIGPDIGCGIDAFCLGFVNINMEALDRFIRAHIPAGRAVRDMPAKKYFTPWKELVRLVETVASDDYRRIMCGIGTLGGGNHFIEIDRDPSGGYHLVIHSGSRYLGQKVCLHHMARAKVWIRGAYSGAGAFYGMEIMPLESGGDACIRDMDVTRRYAELNREIMARIIIEDFFGLKFSACERISSIHNYYNPEDGILRKGAIAAPAGKRVIIPLNMRDGSIIATGKGNPDWNGSAPHGAGRLFSRSESKGRFSMNEYREAMKGIHSSSVTLSTLDESPMVYKPADEIMERISGTVDVDFVMKPVYNFKAGYL